MPWAAGVEDRSPPRPVRLEHVAEAGDGDGDVNVDADGDMVGHVAGDGRRAVAAGRRWPLDAAGHRWVRALAAAVAEEVDRIRDRRAWPGWDWDSLAAAAVAEAVRSGRGRRPGSVAGASEAVEDMHRRTARLHSSDSSGPVEDIPDAWDTLAEDTCLGQAVTASVAAVAAVAVAAR